MKDAASGNPIVELVDSSITDDARITTVRALGDDPSPPIAPASLSDLATRATVIELHQLVGREGSIFTFATFGSTETPSVGRYVLTGWWLPGALELVTDATKVWRQARYDSDGLPDTGPDFCLLTYENFRTGDLAYTDGRGSWISTSGYQKFIARDILRLRGGSSPSG